MRRLVSARKRALTALGVGVIASAAALALMPWDMAPLVGWDVAITPRGPVIIELEPDGGDPSVTQLASGRGLLDGPYGAWLKGLRKGRRR